MDDGVVWPIPSTMRYLTEYLDSNCKILAKDGMVCMKNLSPTVVAD